MTKTKKIKKGYHLTLKCKECCSRCVVELDVEDGVYLVRIGEVDDTYDQCFVGGDAKFRLKRCVIFDKRENYD